MLKPTVFIGSSVEQLPVARAFRACLESEASVSIWDEGVFKLGSSTLDDLLRAVDEFDFAIFVFKADDLTRIRQTESPTVRDNVVFELGLFMGRLGKHRTFWVTPRGSGQPHIPTDLLGINTATFENPAGTISTGDLRAVIGAACDRIRDSITRLKRRTDRSVDELESPRILCAASPEYCKLGFTADVDAINSRFPKTVTTLHDADAARLRMLLLEGNWDIIHLVTNVDTLTGDILFDEIGASGSQLRSGGGRNRIPAEGFVQLVESLDAHLIVLNVCDSLALAAKIARVTNVVAGFRMIEVNVAVDWTLMFYTLLANGKTMSVAFDISQKATDAGLVLLTKRDFRVSNPSLAD